MRELESLSDAELASRLPNGDKEVVQEVYLRYSKLLLDYAKTMLRDDAMAEDAVADIFTWLLVNQTTIQIHVTLLSYLYRSIKNNILNQMSKAGNRERYVNSLKDYYNSGVHTTEEEVLFRETSRRINQVIDEMPEKMRIIYQMSRNENLTHQEIAESTGTAPGTINIHLSRALKRLRVNLRCWFF